MVWMEGKTMRSGMVGMDVLRSMDAQQIAAAYDRGAITWTEYGHAMSWHKEERQAAGKAPAAYTDRMTERDEQGD